MSHGHGVGVGLARSIAALYARTRVTASLLCALLVAGCTTHGLVGALPTLADPGAAAEIVVIREWRWIGNNFNFTVVLDGVPIYEIAAMNTSFCASRPAITSSPSPDAAHSPTTPPSSFLPSHGTGITIGWRRARCGRTMICRAAGLTSAPAAPGRG
jgi:hypothetical protein